MADIPLVAREPELIQLYQWLDQAAAGQGQAVFVTGEAGSGKTALMTEFVNQICGIQYPDLVAAFGDCDAQFGMRDPYRPFIEIMEQLTGNVTDQLQQPAQNRDRLRELLNVSGALLGELGPDLIDIFVPGAGLLTRAGAYVAERTGWVDKLAKNTRSSHDGEISQTDLVEQYCQVILSIARQNTLVLVLDDLQWIDTASAVLLKHLLTRLSTSRLLLIGAYRPAEVQAASQHPLKPILAGLPVQVQPIRLALPVDADEDRQRAFVIDFLEARYPANEFDAGFVELVFEQTRGHPLFVIELLRDLEERGLLTQVQGRWMQAQPIRRQDLPARLSKVIEQRLGNLDEQLQDILAVAAVEGEEFTAQVIAAVEGIDERQLIKLLSRRLAGQHGLIQEWKITNANHRSLLIYRFLQNMVREYLYENLSELERCMLHGAVARQLEGLYQGREEEAAPALARHYSAAREFEKAIRFLLLAGDRAMAKYANHEALDYYNQARDLSRNIVDPPRDLILQLLTQRGKVLGLMGYTDEALHDYHHALVLAQEARLRLEEGWLLKRIANLHLVHRNLDKALAYGQEAEKIGAELDDQELRADALNDIAMVHMHRGHLETAIAALKEAVPCYQCVENEIQAIQASSMRGRAHLLQGQADEAIEAFQIAIDLLRKTGDPRELPFNLRMQGLAYMLYRNEYQTAIELFEESERLYRTMDDHLGLAWTLVMLASAKICVGELEKAVALSEEAGALARDAGDPEVTFYAAATAGKAELARGNERAALTHLEPAMAISREVESMFGALVPAYLAMAIVPQSCTKALDYLEEALARVEHGQVPWTAMEVLHFGAEVCIRCDDLNRARNLIAQLQSQAESYGAREFSAWALLLQARVLRATGDPAYESAYQQGIALARELGNALLLQEQPIRPYEH